MLFISGNHQEWTLGGRMWMAAQITVIATVCLSCYFSFILLEEEENRCIELHLFIVSLYFLWIWILVFIRGRILILDGSIMAIPLVPKLRMLQVPFGFSMSLLHMPEQIEWLMPQEPSRVSPLTQTRANPPVTQNAHIKSILATSLKRGASVPSKSEQCIK